ncbi:MAG: fibronectin type III domain-containing protein [Acidobacteria bacterium]|nr:fibronectin type III domain-containing protein [Acidobacteriota bacterium]
MTATVLGGSRTIAPTGTVSFFEPLISLAPLPGTISYTTVTDPNTGNLDLQGILIIKPSFTAGYSANYNGDANYPTASTCCATFVTVNGNDFALSAQQSSATVSAGFSTFYHLIVGLQSNTSPVSFGANACSGLPAETTCNISPDPTSITGLANIQISTTAPHGIPNAKGSSDRSQLFWAGSMLPFAAILLIGYRGIGTKHSLSRLLLTLLLLLGIACGGGGSNGGGGGGTLPSAPTGLTATAASYNQINLNWTQQAATGFTIYRSTTSGFTPSASSQIASYPSGYSSSYPDSGLTPSTKYYYVVEATNSSGSSGPSSQASATTQALDPGTPAGTYNITVTGTSGAISHSVNLTLVVR